MKRTYTVKITSDDMVAMLKVAPESMTALCHAVDAEGDSVKRAVRCYGDPAHGWLEVPTGDLGALGIAERVSRYSYTDGANVYLEEDMDAHLYLKAAEAAGWRVHVLQQATLPEQNFIRALPRYAGVAA